MSDIEVTIDYIKSLENNQNVLLVDVREPSELDKTGTIPGSINIPLANLEQTLQNASNSEFQTLYKRDRPNLETPLVFSCQSGRRSLAALETAKKLGYVNVKHYPGGWSGWQRHLQDVN